MVAMPLRGKARQLRCPDLTAPKRLPYFAIRMTNLNAIAVSSTANLWWRSSTYAARWRD